MLTQFISYEEAVWCEAYLRGKDKLNLFVHLKGSCQFIRRDVLEKLEGFDEAVLSEDMEISARLVENDYKIRYASDVVAWQESPSNLKTLFKQRTRWFRGTMEVAFKYGRLMTKLNRINFDAETTLFGPFILIASLAPYLAAFWAFSSFWSLDVMWRLVVQFGILTTSLTMLTLRVSFRFTSLNLGKSGVSFGFLLFTSTGASKLSLRCTLCCLLFCADREFGRRPIRKAWLRIPLLS